MNRAFVNLARVFLLLPVLWACGVTAADDDDTPSAAPAPVPGITAITVTPNPADMVKGGALQFYAAVTATGSISRAVTWSVEGAKKTETLISNTGRLYIAPDETAENLTVKAVSSGDKTQYGSVLVGVWEPGETPEEKLTVTSISIRPVSPPDQKIHILRGESRHMQAIINDIVVTQNVTWSFSAGLAPKSAETTISGDGLLTIGDDETRAEMWLWVNYNPDTSITTYRRVIPHDADEVKGLVISPRAPQETYMGAPEEYALKYTVKVSHFGGVALETLPGIAYSGSAAPYFDTTTGVFTPPAPGTYRLIASYGGKSVESGDIIVHGADYMLQPYYYPGTGVTYQGYQGPGFVPPDDDLIASHSGAGAVPIITRPVQSQNNVTITWPPENVVNADRIITIAGTNPDPDTYIRVWVEYVPGVVAMLPRNGPTSILSKGGKEFINYTQYGYVSRNTDFQVRIFFRYVPGFYMVEVEQLTKEGESSLSELFFVNNTRNEPSVNDTPDRRYIFPFAQKFVSDDLRVMNMVRDMTDGLTDPIEKADSIHRWMVRNIRYDHIRFLNSPRQPRIVLFTRFHDFPLMEPEGYLTAICEGYSFVAATLYRTAGFEAKSLGGTARGSDGTGGNHQWNHIYINGSWKFLDVTWDDSDSYLQLPRYKYFLLPTLDGINHSHHYIPSNTDDD